jgi:hypothetical protein
MFHMAEFVAKPEAKHKPFCDWDNPKKDRVYEKLASIINTRARKGFGAPKAAFDKTAPRQFRARYADDHYTYAVHCCIGLIKQWRQAYGVTTPIHYVFDRGSPREQIKRVWDIPQSHPPAVEDYGFAPNGYSFEDKKLFKPLHAADILAWQIRNHMRRVIMEGKDDVAFCHKAFKMPRVGRDCVSGSSPRNNCATISSI